MRQAFPSTRYQGKAQQQTTSKFKCYIYIYIKICDSYVQVLHIYLYLNLWQLCFYSIIWLSLLILPYLFPISFNKCLYYPKSFLLRCSTNNECVCDGKYNLKTKHTTTAPFAATIPKTAMRVITISRYNINSVNKNEMNDGFILYS